MQNVKQQLLATDQFIDNEALDLYVELIQQNITQERVVGQTDRHHILPESLFESRGLLENNTENCLVNLFFADHILAHYYLWQAAKASSDQKYFNAGAVQLLTRRELPKVRQQLIDKLPEYQALRENYILLVQERMTGRDVSSETKQKLSKSHLGVPLSEAHKKALRKPKSTTARMKKPKSKQAKLNMSLAHLGKSTTPHTDETKLKISTALQGHEVSDYVKEKSREANLGKKCLYKDGKYKWFYSEESIIEALTAGWRPKGMPRKEAMKNRVKQLHTGRIWVTNGENTKQIFPEDLAQYTAAGYKRGRKVKTKEN